MIVCYLGIGANLGKRRENIRAAVRKISRLQGTKVIKFSRIIETKAVGGPPAQGKFLNAALKIRTRLSPTSLLKELQHIEKGLGRIRRRRWGARTIDLDILLYGHNFIQQKNLKVPHPRMFGREFVMRPLLEIL